MPFSEDCQHSQIRSSDLRGTGKINTGERFTAGHNHLLVDTPQDQCYPLQRLSYPSLIKTKGNEILVCFKPLLLNFEI